MFPCVAQETVVEQATKEGEALAKPCGRSRGF